MELLHVQLLWAETAAMTTQLADQPVNAVHSPTQRNLPEVETWVAGDANPAAWLQDYSLSESFGSESSCNLHPAAMPGVDRLTSIFWAVQQGNDAMVQLLIDKGADLSQRDSEGRVLLHYAAANNHVSVLKLLLKNLCDPNARDGQGQSPLFSAVRPGHLDATTLLLEHGAEPNTWDNNNNVPLHTAVDQRLLSIAEVLIIYGAEVDR